MSDEPTAQEIAELISQCRAIPKLGEIARGLAYSHDLRGSEITRQTKVQLKFASDILAACLECHDYDSLYGRVMGVFNELSDDPG